MTLILPAPLLDEIRRHGEAAYPLECCGLIGGTVEGDAKRAARLVVVPNRRTDAATNRYLIDPEDFRGGEAALRRAGLEVVGVYHSHPDSPARPSAFDSENAWPWLSYCIVRVAAGRAHEVTGWVLKDDRTGFDPEPIRNTKEHAAL